MEQPKEQANLGTFPVIRERLELIYREKYQLFRAIVRGRGVRPSHEGEVIHDTYIRLLSLVPQGNILALLKSWKRTDLSLARLDQNLSALFVYYLKLNIPRREPPEPAPVPEPTVDPYPNLNVHLALKQIDAVVGEMYAEKVVTELEWKYWQWRRSHPEDSVTDFAESLDPPLKPGGWIKRLERTLFQKIARRIGASPLRQASSSRRGA